MTLWIHEPSSTYEGTEIVAKKDDGSILIFNGVEFVPSRRREPASDEVDHTTNPSTPYWQRVEL